MSALPQRHSLPSDSLGFRGAETESSPLPFNNGSSRFGSVSVSTYWQALSGLSWLSFSPSAVSADRRVRSRTRSRLSPGRELPTPGALNGHRHNAFRPDPTHGIYTRFNPPHRTMNDAIRRHPTFVCPCRPISHGRTSDRTSGLLPHTADRNVTPGGDYADEPPSNRTSASPRIRLYENSTPRWLDPRP